MMNWELREQDNEEPNNLDLGRYNKLIADVFEIQPNTSADAQPLDTAKEESDKRPPDKSTNGVPVVQLQLLVVTKSPV